jgi:hypothetical protein
VRPRNWSPVRTITLILEKSERVHTLSCALGMKKGHCNDCLVFFISNVKLVFLTLSKAKLVVKCVLSYYVSVI